MIKLKIRGMTISHTSYKKRERDKQKREIEKSIQKKTEDYERSRDEKFKFEIDILQSKLQYIKEIKIQGIVTRAKATWKTEGEKCSRYFSNLEKRLYTDKIIPKLISQDGTEKSNISDILSEQQSFYKHLYSSTNPVINDVHKNAFLNDENPFITKISEDQKQLCERELTEQEYIKTLKKHEKYEIPRKRWIHNRILQILLA
jgi:hypothetical protein